MQPSVCALDKRPVNRGRDHARSALHVARRVNVMTLSPAHAREQLTGAELPLPGCGIADACLAELYVEQSDFRRRKPRLETVPDAERRPQAHHPKGLEAATEWHLHVRLHGTPATRKEVDRESIVPQHARHFRQRNRRIEHVLHHRKRIQEVKLVGFEWELESRRIDPSKILELRRTLFMGSEVLIYAQSVITGSAKLGYVPTRSGAEVKDSGARLERPAHGARDVLEDRKRALTQCRQVPFPGHSVREIRYQR